MEIKTKFDLGQQVCRKEDGQPMVIIQIIFEVCNGDCVIPVQYLCMFNDTCHKYFENELTETPKPKSVFELGNYDEYFYIDECGDVKIKLYTYDGFDKKRVAQGNAFLTVNEAEKEAKRREIHQRLKKLAGGYEFKFKKRNYFIHLDEYKSIRIGMVCVTYMPNIVYFASEEAANDAINEIGAETLMRDYFEIED